jgi:hypothetical protein
MIGVKAPEHSRLGNRLTTGRLRRTNGSSPGKRRNRVSRVVTRDMSGNATNQDLNLLHEPIFCATIQQ